MIGTAETFAEQRLSGNWTNRLSSATSLRLGSAVGIWQGGNLQSSWAFSSTDLFHSPLDDLKGRGSAGPGCLERLLGGRAVRRTSNEQSDGAVRYPYPVLHPI